jgi:hypothetical protein
MFLGGVSGGAPPHLRAPAMRRLATFLHATLALLLVVGLLGPAVAHDLPDELEITVLIEPGEGRVAAAYRVPLALLEGIGLPKRGPGYLDLGALDEPLERAAAALVREIALFADGQELVPDRVASRISLPSEDAFGSLAGAREHVLGPPLPPTTNVFWNQGYFDAYAEFPVPGAAPSYALDIRVAPGLASLLRLDVVFAPATREPVSYHVHADHGWLELDPGPLWVIGSFVRGGADHLFTRVDQLLFLLCLLLAFRAWQQPLRLAPVLAGYAGGFSLALLAAAGGLVTPGPWLLPLAEVVVAAAITYMALENIVVAWIGPRDPAGPSWRWALATGFGLAFGLRFAAAVQADLQFAGLHPGLAILAFDLGLILGHVALLLVAVPLLGAVLATRRAHRVGCILGSALLAHTGWHWLLERADRLRWVYWPEVAGEWPLLLALMIVVAALAAAAVWLARPRRLHRPRPAPTRQKLPDSAA